MDADSSGAPSKKRNSTCYRCGKSGHIWSECPNPPKTFKRTREVAQNAHAIEFLEDGDDYDDYADEEAEEEDDYEERVYLVVEPESALVAVERDSLYRGCLVVDTGCSCSVSSLRAAYFPQLDRLEEECSFWNDVTLSY